MTVLSGKCLCGQVRISVRGEPLRVGICHCTDCRRESGSAFTSMASGRPANSNIQGKPPRFKVGISAQVAVRACFPPMIMRPKSSLASSPRRRRRLCRATNSGSNAASRGCGRSKAPSSMTKTENEERF
ncbi:hypothetical protein HFO14_18530 [Rhizobium laguerreae]|nr:hypothetical protein [Rhizobium laguerreae]